MLRILKYSLIFLVILTIWYACDFYANLKQEDIQEVKQDAIEAIDTGDATKFTGSISQKIKEDLHEKKNHIFGSIKNKLEKIIGWVFDS